MNDICKAYGQLASAVIMQAVQDYKTTLNGLTFSEAVLGLTEIFC